MKSIISFTAALLIGCQLLVAGTIEVQPGKKNELRLIENTWQKVVVSLTTAEIRTLAVTAGNQAFTRLIMPSYSRTDLEGSPELPVKREFIEVPLNASVRIEVIRASYQDYDLAEMGYFNPVMPAQAPVPKNAEVIPFAYDQEAYQTNAFTPDAVVSCELLGMMRSFRIGRLDLFPVQYNPVTHTLRVYEVIEAAVFFDDADIGGTIDLRQKYENFYFQSLGRNILNYEPLSGRDTVTDYPITYLIVSDPMFQEQLQPFVQWKTQQGFKVIEAYTNDPEVGNSTSAIKGYIQDLYNNPGTGQQPPSFVLFVGDIQQIPAWNGTQGSHVTDLYYCEYTNDRLPEIYYGRFSAQNPSQLQPQIDKTLQYEKYTMPDPSYLSEVVMIAGMDANFGQDWANGQINYGTINYFNSSNGINSHTYLYPGSGSHSADIRQDISNGVTFANYTAHGGPDGWSSPSFSNSHIPSLQNQDKYGLLVGNCCLTSKYDVSECFAEALLRAENKGSIGYIGASNNTYWDEDYYFGVGVGQISENPPSYEETTLGMYDRAFHTHGEPWADWYTTMDQHVFAGNLAVTLGSPGSATYYWEVYNTMGDPSLMIYYSEPPALEVSYEPLVPLNTPSFNIETEPYAYVGLSVENTLKAAALADAEGLAVISLSEITIPCTADVVITAQNRQPYFGTVLIANQEGPYIVLNRNEVFELSGYTNNKIEPGEVVGMNIELKNYGEGEGTDVVAVLSSFDEYVTISDSYETCGTIPGQSLMEFENAFSVIIGENIPDGHEVEFLLTIQDAVQDSWNSEIRILLTAPVLNLNRLTVNDTDGGNGNGRLDPGENAKVTAYFSNLGHTIARNTLANLCAHSGFISIPDPDYMIGNLGLFGETPVTFNVSVDEDAPNGILVDFEVNLTSGAYELHETHPLKIGMICEDYETGTFNSFPWVQGGNAPWTVDGFYPFEGFYSMRSGAITHSQTSEVSLSYYVMQGDSISFYRKVSASTGDSLKFMIDGVVAGRWSGTSSGWKRVSYYVAEGSHQFKWAYVKNSTGSGGSDAAWVDYILLPPSLSTTIFAGEDDRICNGDVFTCQGQATNYQTVSWSTSGSGTFSNNSSLNPEYTPSAEDISNGSVDLSLNISDLNGDAFSDGMTLAILGMPDQPAMPSGPDYIYIDTTFVSDFTVEPVPDAISYRWVAEPAEAGIFTGDGTTGVMIWNRNFLGTAFIHVSALNDCGESQVSQGLEVTVENSTVGYSEPDRVPFSLSVFPNPSSGILNIVAEGENINNLEIMLLDLMGKTVGPCKGYNPCRVSVDHLPPGIYILIARTEKFQVTRKIIVR